MLELLIVLSVVVVEMVVVVVVMEMIVVVVVWRCLVYFEAVVVISIAI